MSIDVTHYGVHWAPSEIAFLHQARGGTNAVGAAVNSPFHVKTKRKWNVNHLFGINAVNPARSHLEALQVILERNSLARFLIPLPKEHGDSVGLLSCGQQDETLLKLTCLLKMSNPIRMPVIWANLANPATVVAELEMTNVQPLVLMGVQPAHMAWVRDAMSKSVSAPRKLLVVADPNVSLTLAKTLDDTDLSSRALADLMAFPWETFGNVILRAYMRREWDGLWFSREPTPGNEAKVQR